MAGAERQSLANRRVLVVEDEYFLAADTARALQDAGAKVVGPAATVTKALALIEAAAPDLAVIDLNLKGEPSFPVADALGERGVPFVFTTGYDRAAIPARFAHVARWEKPFDVDRLLDAIVGLAGGA